MVLAINNGNGILIIRVMAVVLNSDWDVCGSVSDDSFNDEKGNSESVGKQLHVLCSVSFSVRPHWRLVSR